MIILGIDPGLAITGWGVIEKSPNLNLLDYGVIKTSAKKEQNSRFFYLYKEIQKIIGKYKPSVLAIEKLFFNTNAKTAFLIGEARGVVKICGTLNKIKIKEFTPLQIKNCIVGYGRATKSQVQQMTKMLLKLKQIPKPDDAADALAVALTYCFHKQELEK